MKNVPVETEISISLVRSTELVSHKHVTMSPEQKSETGVILSFLGQIMQERELGSTR